MSNLRDILTKWVGNKETVDQLEKELQPLMDAVQVVKERREGEDRREVDGEIGWVVNKEGQGSTPPIVYIGKNPDGKQLWKRNERSGSERRDEEPE